MARPQENPALFTTPYSPITEREKEGVDDYPEASVGGGCGCFRRFCFGLDEGESHNHLLQERGGGRGVHKEAWLVAQLKKLKQISELVAGPKWKNMIRKIGKLCNPKKYNTQNTQFQYSPESYALNFAGGEDHEEDGTLLHNFSSRFAPHALISDQQRRAGL
ncbi:hypothetical protein Pfo_003480 [Paulownia fortunei]|nr:hypothetical protein Pfo_003480 [Paulownia fortunei]